MRTEFGFQRTSCVCRVCVDNCKFMPGYLIPADLIRLIPEGIEPLAWAEQNLLASPGAVLRGRDGKHYQVPTLVPATKPDGSCIHLDENERCKIHQIAPFGCAFFSCIQTKAQGDEISLRGLLTIIEAWQNPVSLYPAIWKHLDAKGLRSPKAQEKLRRMLAARRTH